MRQMTKKSILIGFCVLAVTVGALSGMVADDFFSSYGGRVLDKEMVADSGWLDSARITLGTEGGMTKRRVPHAVYRAVKLGDIVQKPRYGWAITIAGARYHYLGMTLALVFMALLVCAGTVFSFVRHGPGGNR